MRESGHGAAPASAAEGALYRPVALLYLLRGSSDGGTRIALLNRAKWKSDPPRLDQFFDIPGGGIEDAYPHALRGELATKEQILQGGIDEGREELWNDTAHRPFELLEDCLDVYVLDPAINVVSGGPPDGSTDKPWMRDGFTHKRNHAIIATPKEPGQLSARWERSTGDSRRPLLQYFPARRVPELVNPDKARLYEDAVASRDAA